MIRKMAINAACKKMRLAEYYLQLFEKMHDEGNADADAIEAHSWKLHCDGIRIIKRFKLEDLDWQPINEA